MDKNYTYINDDLLAKYLLGEADFVEQQQVKEWVKSSDANQKQLEDFKAILEVSRFQIINEVNEHEALGRLNLRLENQPKINYSMFFRYAAVLAVFLTMGWFFYVNLIANKLNVSTNGNTLTQYLPDGSIVILNKKSSLSFIGGFFNKTRQIKLKGEAFFKVSPNKEKPFIIDVNHVKVTVVGTEFNVKSEGKKTIVIVESGIVKVNNLKDSIRLIAGEKVEANENLLHLHKEENKGKLYNYYYSNELICNKTPLAELVSVLNEKFKTHIVIENPALKSLPISTTFKNESLKEILNVISETFKIKVEYGVGIIKLK